MSAPKSMKIRLSVSQKGCIRVPIFVCARLRERERAKCIGNMKSK